MEHFDVLIVGAGLSGIGAACTLQSAVSLGLLRHLRGPRRHRRHLGPLPLPRRPLRLGHVHPRLLPPPVGRREVDRRRRLDPRATSGRPPSRPGIDQNIRFGHRILSLHWRSRGGPLARRGPTDRDGATELMRRWRSPPTSSSPAPATTATTMATGPTFPALDRFAGTIVHPQAWPADLDGSGKRIVVIGSGATAVTLVPALATTARHVTMLQRSPSYIASLPARDPVADRFRRLLPGALCQSRHPLVQGAHDSRLLPVEPASTGLRQAAPAPPGHAPSCRPATTSTPTSPPTTTPGTRGSASSPTAICSRPSRTAPPRSSPITSSPSPRPASGSDRGRNSRPTSSSPPPAWNSSSSVASS